jgi:integrase
LERLRAVLLGQQPRDQPCPAPAAVPPPKTVAESTAEFLDRRKAKISATCHQTYRIALAHFATAFGTRAVTSLTGEEIEDWADRPAWSSSTQHDYLGVVQCWLKWAKHPLTIRRPPKESRGAEAVLSDTQFEKVLKLVTGDLNPLLRVLRETGARPQEIARLTADMVDWQNACHRTKVHKSRKHGERVIHFNATAMELLRGQRRLHPTGALFRNKQGRAFNKDGIVHRMAAVSKRLGFRAIAYGTRHSFATAALVAGTPDAVVAELLGHRGTAMVASHYGHVSGQAKVLKDAVERLGKRAAG